MKVTPYACLKRLFSNLKKTIAQKWPTFTIWQTNSVFLQGVSQTRENLKGEKIIAN